MSKAAVNDKPSRCHSQPQQPAPPLPPATSANVICCTSNACPKSVSGIVPASSSFSCDDSGGGGVGGGEGTCHMAGAPPPVVMSSTSLSPVTFSSGISPMDPDMQERLKLERKRARNRVAATKCRRRKIEKILELEAKVQEISEQNDELAQRAQRLRGEIAGLQRVVAEHCSKGCNAFFQMQRNDNEKNS
ncbi:unnamed protein product [Soboliphyme baturini]|uniref:BZIP domain-containing protein n=1 Tax=Soboliphyme baturini TaxID=241478 RepID=A0A3P8EUN3_9BILA|nr:unnamed protein product [Soboliphyme baturini]